LHLLLLYILVYLVAVNGSGEPNKGGCVLPHCV